MNEQIYIYCMCVYSISYDIFNIKMKRDNEKRQKFFNREKKLLIQYQGRISYICAFIMNLFKNKMIKF